MSESANLPDPKTADAAQRRLDQVIEEAKRAGRAALDANEPPGAERVPEQEETLASRGGEFPLGMGQTLDRAAERMRHSQQEAAADLDREAAAAERDELGEADDHSGNHSGNDSGNHSADR